MISRVLVVNGVAVLETVFFSEEQRAGSWETSVNYHYTTRRHIPENSNIKLENIIIIWYLNLNSAHPNLWMLEWLLVHHQISECREAKTARLLSYPLRLRTQQWRLAPRLLQWSMCMKLYAYVTWYGRTALWSGDLHTCQGRPSIKYWITAVGGPSIRKPKLPVSIIPVSSEKTALSFNVSGSLFWVMCRIFPCFPSADFLPACI